MKIKSHKGGRTVRLSIRCKPEIKAMLQLMVQAGGEKTTEADVINDLVIVGYRERFGPEALAELIEEFKNE